MGIKDILPSTRFTTIVGSIALAGFLVWGAYVLTHPTHVPAEVAVGTSAAPNLDWQKTLNDIQAQSPLNQAPQAPSQDVVDRLNRAAQSDNVTDTVARTLLVNLSAAKSAGLGNDIPTQDQLIGDAVTQINGTLPAPTYTATNLTITQDSPDATKAYGNTFISTLAKHPKANYNSVLYIVGTSTGTMSLKPLQNISSEYAALGRDMARISVPETLAPIHLQLVNDFSYLAQTVADMQTAYTDPLRALAALQRFDSLNQESLRLFINIAQDFSQNGILFNTDEPGAAWSSLVP